MELVSRVAAITTPQAYRGLRGLPTSAGAIQGPPGLVGLATGRLAITSVYGMAYARLLATQPEHFRSTALFTGFEPKLHDLDLRRPDLPATSWRQRELIWRQANAAMLQERFRDNWVALERESIIAFGPSAVDVARTARAKGVVSPYIFLVTEDQGGDIGFFGV